MLSQCRQVVENAGKEYNPALIANYAYALAKEYHRYYHEVKVLHAESEAAQPSSPQASHNRRRQKCYTHAIACHRSVTELASNETAIRQA